VDSAAADKGPGPKASARRLRLCLAASGGGHVRQLLDLEPAWSSHDYFFVTEDTALGRSIGEQHRSHFIPHYAAGQARLGHTFQMLGGAVRNFLRSAAIILKERPQVVISTGAGAVFFTVLWARLLGAKIVVVESFARFDRPSLFGRLAAPLAHELIVQSSTLVGYGARAKVFDPLRILDKPRPKKDPVLFATVGATLPFERLVRSVAELKAAGDIPESVIIQTGEGGSRPAGAEVVETLPFDEVQALLVRADIVVCHGGTGSLITALRQGCRTIAMPRLFELGEHYDNHQAEITQAFAARGLIQVANSPDELRAALRRAREIDPPCATTDPSALIAHLQQLFQRWQKKTR
jgi:UDP-N-acetylglucosamine--N-acetylmuramyl-(pentapeptide) pyrophosphoryl-undecaprenol N-acetylglucosamine transferase